MPNASRVRIIDEDFSFQALGALTGISGFVGTFERGPVGVVSNVITSALELRRLYGGHVEGNIDYLLAERILNRGGNLRILNLRHYDDITDPSSLTALRAGAQSIEDGEGTILAEITPKYPGAAYNNLKVEVLNPSNGLATDGYFDLKIYIEGDEFYTTETYQNLVIEGNPTAVNGTWLDRVRQSSKLVNIEYKDTSAATAPITPAKSTISFADGSDGSPVLPADYVGSSAGKTGFHAFDGFNDMYEFAAPSVSEPTIHIAGANYAESRQDMEYLAHLDFSGGVQGIIDAREAITVNSKYYSLFSGGVRVLHPVTGQEIVIPEVADVMGISNYVANEQFPWIATDNYVKGYIPNALGVGLNLGYDDLNLLANRQVNMIVADHGTVYLKGNFSGQSAFSKNSWRNVVKLIIYTKKTLRPSLERYLGEPNDFATWKQMYNEVKPFLTYLEDNRAVYPGGWQWQGDQYATKMSELQVNNPDDLDAGKYQVRLSLNPIPGINEIDLYIAINSAGVDFTDAV